MKINHTIALLVLSAFIFGSCNITNKLTIVSDPYASTNNEKRSINSDNHAEIDYQPSTSLHEGTTSPPSNEIVFYSSIEEISGENLLTENELIISPKQEILPDTLPTNEWLSQSQLARESKIAGIWGLAIFILAPYVSIVLGIIAITKGRRAQKAIAKSPESYINAGDAVAGIVMGSIILGLIALGLIVLGISLLASSGLINLPQW